MKESQGIAPRFIAAMGVRPGVCSFLVVVLYRYISAAAVVLSFFYFTKGAKVLFSFYIISWIEISFPPHFSAHTHAHSLTRAHTHTHTRARERHYAGVGSPPSSSPPPPLFFSTSSFDFSVIIASSTETSFLSDPSAVMRSLA